MCAKFLAPVFFCSFFFCCCFFFVILVASSLLHFFSIKPVAFYLMLPFPLEVIEFIVRKVSIGITFVSKRDTF